MLVDRFAAVLATCLFVAGTFMTARQGGDPPVAPDWKTYTDTDFAFRLSYPPRLVPLRNIAPDDLSVARIRFVDRRLAAGELASRQPGELAVTVFRNDEAIATPVALENWIRRRGWLRQGAAVSALLSLDGASASLDVSDPAQMAPNETAYLATAERIYAIARNGPDALAMQRSLRLLMPR